MCCETGYDHGHHGGVGPNDPFVVSQWITLKSITDDGEGGGLSHIPETIDTLTHQDSDNCVICGDSTDSRCIHCFERICHETSSNCSERSCSEHRLRRRTTNFSSALQEQTEETIAAIIGFHRYHHGGQATKEDVWNISGEKLLPMYTLEAISDRIGDLCRSTEMDPDLAICLKNLKLFHQKQNEVNLAELATYGSDGVECQGFEDSSGFDERTSRGGRGGRGGLVGVVVVKRKRKRKRKRRNKELCHFKYHCWIGLHPVNKSCTVLHF